MFLVVTTPSAPITIAAAMIPKNTFSAIMLGRARCGPDFFGAPGRSSASPGDRYPARGRSPLRRVRSAALRSPRRTRFPSFLGLLGAHFQGLGFGHGLHPLAQLFLVVEQVGDAGLRVL